MATAARRCGEDGVDAGERPAPCEGERLASRRGERIVHTLDPIFDANSRILVLGTMPSPRSREAGFYYAHPQNRFWRVMERLYGLDDHALSDNGARRAFLLAQRIALWDVLAACEIAGASDASIAHPEPNDLTCILDHALIEAVCTTGGKAARLCRRFNEVLIAKRGIRLIELPSTSPANARMRIADLAAAYRAADVFVDRRALDAPMGNTGVELLNTTLRGLAP